MGSQPGCGASVASCCHVSRYQRPFGFGESDSSSIAVSNAIVAAKGARSYSLCVGTRCFNLASLALHRGVNEVDALARPPPREALILITTFKPLVAPEMLRVTDATPDEFVVALMV